MSNIAKELKEIEITQVEELLHEISKLKYKMISLHKFPPSRSEGSGCQAPPYLPSLQKRK